MFIVFYFVLSLIKYFLLYFGVLNINQAIHTDMINGITRSPCSYFDIKSSGQLHNKFSNDLGIMDNVLTNVLSDSI